MPNSTITRELQEELLDALLDTPGADERAGRNALLTGVPGPLRAALNRADNARVDLTGLLDQLDRLGRLDNGERPLVIMAHNGARAAAGSELGRRLAALEARIGAHYGAEPPERDLPDHPEFLIFGGPGEWVTKSFMEQAQAAGRRVARLLVPRFEGGQRVGGGVGALGTGWLVGPRLLLTNHHVVQAREPNEPPAAAQDFALQGKGTEAWFDYHLEGGDKAAVRAAEVLCSSSTLDYALLRLAEDAGLAGRGHFALPRERPALEKGARLNIVQCPDGGPLRFAIRNNFLVGPGEKPYQLRYLTDTKAGSSGSPVLDDSWQVVAMHRGFKQVDPQLTKGEAGRQEVAKFHNEGIVIHDVLADLAAGPRGEIERAQGWA